MVLQAKSIAQTFISCMILINNSKQIEPAKWQQENIFSEGSSLLLSPGKHTSIHKHTHTHAQMAYGPFGICFFPAWGKMKLKGSLPTESRLTMQRRRLRSTSEHHSSARSTKAPREAEAIYILHLRRRQMNCSFIAYPAEPEHKNVLEVFREPIGRKNGEGSADM